MLYLYLGVCLLFACFVSDISTYPWRVHTFWMVRMGVTMRWWCSIQICNCIIDFLFTVMLSCILILPLPLWSIITCGKLNPLCDNKLSLRGICDNICDLLIFLRPRWPFVMLFIFTFEFLWTSLFFLSIDMLHYLHTVFCLAVLSSLPSLLHKVLGEPSNYLVGNCYTLEWIRGYQILCHIAHFRISNICCFFHQW